MIKQLLYRINELCAEKRVVFFSLMCTIIFTLLFIRMENSIAGPRGVGFISLQLSFSKVIFEGILASWGSEGIALYETYLWMDFLNIISYTVLLISAPAYFTALQKEENNSLHSQNLVFTALPILVAFFDIIENSIHLTMYYQRIFYEWLIIFSSVISSLKWLLMVVCVLYILKHYFFLRKRKAPDG